MTGHDIVQRRRAVFIVPTPMDASRRCAVDRVNISYTPRDTFINTATYGTGQLQTGRYECIRVERGASYSAPPHSITSMEHTYSALKYKLVQPPRLP